MARVKVIRHAVSELISDEDLRRTYVSETYVTISESYVIEAEGKKCDED